MYWTILVTLEIRYTFAHANICKFSPWDSVILVYREYKEALRQQRGQENIYKSKTSSDEHTPSPTSYNNHDNNLSPDKRPVQKVLPSRNISQPIGKDNATVNGCTAYVKPPAPQLVTTSVGFVGNSPSPPRPMTWSRNVPPDKLSFTMRREFEKAKEEAELIQQLRTVSRTNSYYVYFVVQELSVKQC